jgi:hypothetical protein
MAVRLERVVFAKQSLFAGDLLSKKTSKASAGTHNSQPKPEALERDQVTNPKTYCASDTTSDRSSKSMFWTVPF